MSKKNDPAFPTPHLTNANGDVQWGAPGISRLEWFAGMALQGLLAATVAKRAPFANWQQTATHDAYRLAEAMIAESEKRE